MEALNDTLKHRKYFLVKSFDDNDIKELLSWLRLVVIDE